MEYNWRVIKEKILQYCKNAFAENKIILTIEELEEDIVIFYNFISLSLPYSDVGNIRKEMMSALQASCVDEIGSETQLKQVSTLFDSYMKKLIAYTDIDTFDNIKDKCQMQLLKKFGYWGISIPSYSEDNIEKFKGAADGSYLLGMTILTRNIVHVSIEMDDSEVTRRLKCVIAFYIFLIYKTKGILLRKNPNLRKQELNYFGDNPDNALLYDYISYGNSSVEIKKRYASTYAKHQLYSQGVLTEENLIKKMKNFSDNSLQENAAKRILNELLTSQEIEVTASQPKKYSLSSREHERIHDAEVNYNMSLQSFNNSMQEVVVRYQLKTKASDVTNLLMQYLAAQYNYDIDEALGDLGSTDKPNCNKFKTKLKDLGCPDNKCSDLFKELLCVSRDNDVLVRVSAGKAFQSISDPAKFADYIRKADRKVWLDTQILLYLLCYNADYAKYDHPYYKTAMALFRQARVDNFHYKVADIYVNEIVNHFRMALLLISIVDLPFARGKNMSQNVFYRHYRKLCDNDGLPEGIESFADYMKDNFALLESDAFESDYASIAGGVIAGKLEDFNIAVEQLQKLSNKEVEQSMELLKEAARNAGSEKKSDKALRNDAMMGVTLFKHQEQQKPIFITMDNSFEPYRKMYVDRYKRLSSFNWHLFSPAEFLNHIDFIEFRVNSENLTDSLISMIENSEVKDKTLGIIDRVNRFLDIPQLTKVQRKKYTCWVNDLFQSDEYVYKADASSEEGKVSSINRFLDAQDSVFTYFTEKDKESLMDFYKLLQNEDGFRDYLQLLKTFVSEVEANKNDLILKVEISLEEFLKSDVK